MTTLGLLFAGWLRSLRAERSTVSDAPLRSEVLATVAHRETATELVPSALHAAGEQVHRWSDADVAFELDAARRLESMPLADDEGRLVVRARNAKAAWHRRRARAIAKLVQAQDAELGWFNSEHLLCDRPTRLALFVGGPFDGGECRVDLEPRCIRVAHRPTGEGLDGAHLAQEVRPEIGSIILPAPVDAKIVGEYRWDDDNEWFEWFPGGSDA